MSRQNKYGTLFFFLMVLVIAWHFTAVPFIVYGHEFGMSLVHTFAVALVGALALAAPYWLLPRSWRPLSWLPVALSTAWGISQLWYARTYNDIMPLQVFTLTGNVNSLLIDSVLGSVRWADLWIIAPTLLLLLLPVDIAQLSPRVATATEPACQAFCHHCGACLAHVCAHQCEPAVEWQRHETSLQRAICHLLCQRSLLWRKWHYPLFALLGPRVET